MLRKDGDFVLENNILPQSERNEGCVEDLYRIEREPGVEDGELDLWIVEFEREKTELEDAKLVKVEHPEEVRPFADGTDIKYLEEGEALDSIEPIEKVEIKESQVVGEKDGRAELELGEEDPDLLVMEPRLRAGDRRIENAESLIQEVEDETDIQSFLKGALVLSGFLADLPQTSAGNAKYSIFFLHSGGEEVQAVHPREIKSETVVDLGDLDTEGIKELELEWTERHIIEGGIKTASKVPDDRLQDVEVQEIEPKKIEKKDEDGKVEVKGTCEEIEIIPGEYVKLSFDTGEVSENSEATYFLKTEGRYDRVESEE